MIWTAASAKRCLTVAFLPEARGSPVHEGSLLVHEVELPVELLPGGADGCGVGEHGDGPYDWGQVTTGHSGRRLVVDADLTR